VTLNFAASQALYLSRAHGPGPRPSAAAWSRVACCGSEPAAPPKGGNPEGVAEPASGRRGVGGPTGVGLGAAVGNPTGVGPGDRPDPTAGVQDVSGCGRLWLPGWYTSDMVYNNIYRYRSRRPLLR